MRRDLGMEIVLSHPVESVWHALTDPAALAEWMMPVDDFAPVVGQRFRFHGKPVANWDGVINCEVLQVEAPHRLVLRWQGSQMRRATTLTWTLTVIDPSTTRLRLDHQGFEGFGGLAMAAIHRLGWRRMVSTGLPDHLRHRQTPH